MIRCLKFDQLKNTFRFTYENKCEKAKIVDVSELPEGSVHIGEMLSGTFKWFYIYRCGDEFYAIRTARL